MGPLFVAAGLGFLLNQSTYWDMITEVIARTTPTDHLLIYVSGLLSMLAGLAVVNTHGLWTSDWRVVITILGWIMLVGGIIRIVVPNFGLKLGSAVYGSPVALIIVAIISLMLGGFLTFKGYGTSWSKS